MKKIVMLVILGSLLSGCGELSNDVKHIKSTWVGLNRHITLFDANGKAIREWDTKAQVEDRGGSCFFLDANGKAIRIAGTYLIEEK